MVEAKLPTLDQIKKQIPARCFEVCRGDDGTITSRLAERTLPCLSCGLDASSDDSLGYRAYVCGAEEPVAYYMFRDFAILAGLYSVYDIVAARGHAALFVWWNLTGE
jgi:hypothetical protein